MNTVAHILQESRKARGITLKALSDATGIDTALLSHYEHGRRSPTRGQVEKLARELGVDIRSMMITYLSEQLIAQYGSDPLFPEVLAAAEKRSPYRKPTAAGGAGKELSGLLRSCEQLHAEWDGLKPLQDVQLQNLNAHFDTEYTYESNRIEGNTLSLHETSLVVHKGLTIGGKSVREHLEAINHQDAIGYLRQLAQSRQAFSELVIRELHTLVLRGIDPAHAGRYRTINVRISGSTHVPPEFYDVQRQMAALVRWYHQQRKSLHPVVLAADLHHRLVSIHPFTDGNGRTSRLVMNLVLMRAGYLPAIIRGSQEMRHAYYDALESAHVRGSAEPFRIFVAKAVIQSMEDYLDAVRGGSKARRRPK